MGDVVIGVVADTHVPDRIKNLHPDLMRVLEREGVSQILHAGDVSDQSVLDELGTLAPISAVQGNRDLLRNGNTLPKTLTLNVNGVKVGLMHGFGNFWLYLIEKFYFLTKGYQLAYYRRLGVKTFPDADIIVFGHTHRPENLQYDRHLIFNPGSAGMGGWGYPPSCGILRIAGDGSFRAETINLSGAAMENRTWVES
ncbi:MAG: metallophosphoesterase family protein [Anaerolineaceae bacterium]